MQPIKPNLSFSCLPADDLTGQDLINHQINNAGQQELRPLLSRECLTQNQLQRALNRAGMNWNHQEVAWINQRIQTLQQSQIDREIAVPEINSIPEPQYLHTGAAGPARSVLSATEGVRQLTLGSPETSQPQNNSVRGNAAPGSQPSTGARRTVTTATQLPEQALALISANSNKSDDQIEQEIHSNNFLKINNLLDLQPMTKEQLCKIQTLIIRNHLGMIDKRKQTLQKRIDRLQGGERETSTPALRSLYHQNRSGFIENLQTLYNTNPAQRASTLKSLIEFGSSTPPTRTQPSHWSRERVDRDLQRALDASRRDFERRPEPGFSAPPGWGDPSPNKPDTAPEPEKTGEELREENKKLRDALYCQQCPEDNKQIASRLYIHNQAQGHRVHCKEHSLKTGDPCPKAGCGQIINQVIDSYMA